MIKNEFKRGYKFRSWKDNNIQYPEIDYHKRLLTHNEIYFASLGSFNDPFDCKIQLVFDDDNRFRGKVIEYFVSQFPNKSKEEIESNLKNWKVPQQIIKTFIKSYEDHNKSIGIFCLTGNYKHILLWSHYADSHKGYCIEYDLEIMRDNLADNYVTSNLSFLECQVKYMEEMPVVSLSELYDFIETNELIKKEEIVDKQYSSKSNIWQYEDEIRFITLGVPNNTQKISREAITKVIFGCEMEMKHKAEIIEELKSYNIKPRLELAIKSRHSYGLDFETIEY